MDDHKVLEKMDDPAQRLDGIKRTLARFQELDPARIDGMIFAVKLKDDENEQANFKVGSIGNANLILGIMSNAMSNLAESIPGFAEVVAAQAMAGMSQLFGDDDEDDEGTAPNGS